MDIRETREFKSAERFMLRNARPLELAVWNLRYHNGSRESALKALEAFQNEDGGFGWGLEPDCMNPNSSPIQTLAACGALRDIGLKDSGHPLIQGILRYLDSGADFDVDSGEWLTTVPTNNDFPHAVWWSYDPGVSQKESAMRYNPTAALAGFALCFADRSSGLFQRAQNIAAAAAEWLMSDGKPEPHVTGAFAMMYDFMHEAGLPEIPGLRDTLLQRAEQELVPDSSRWFAEYLPKPSDYVRDADSLFCPGREELCREECRLIRSMQLPDGSFPVTWQWFNGYQEYALSVNWWKSRLIINNIRFLEIFGD